MGETDPSALKRAAATRAVALVSDGMRLGLGSGSTAAYFVSLLAERVKTGLDVVGVPTSQSTRGQAEREGVPLTTLEEAPELDLTVDGADEMDDQLRLIKGGGGALLREKIVASASRRMVVIADGSKLVRRLGDFPLPIVIVPFGLEPTRRAIRAAMAQAGCEADLRLRMASKDEPFVTDDGHLILDAKLDGIDSPERLAAGLAPVPGVVEHGIFIGLASGAVIATESGLVELGQV